MNLPSIGESIVEKLKKIRLRKYKEKAHSLNLANSLHNSRAPDIFRDDIIVKAVEAHKSLEIVEPKEKSKHCLNQMLNKRRQFSKLTESFKGASYYEYGSYNTYKAPSNDYSNK